MQTSGGLFGGIFAFLMFGGMITAYIVGIVVIWRAMKAHELIAATLASTLRDIADHIKSNP